MFGSRSPPVIPTRRTRGLHTRSFVRSPTNSKARNGAGGMLRLNEPLLALMWNFLGCHCSTSHVRCELLKDTRSAYNAADDDKEARWGSAGGRRMALETPDLERQIDYFTQVVGLQTSVTGPDVSIPLYVALPPGSGFCPGSARLWDCAAAQAPAPPFAAALADLSSSNPIRWRPCGLHATE